MANVNDDIVDALIRHQIGLQRYSTQTVKKVLAALKRSDAAVIQRLASSDLTGLSRTRQESLLRDIRAILDGVYVDAFGNVSLDLNDLADYEAKYQRDMLKNTVPVELNYTLPNTDQLASVVNARPFQGKIMREWFSELGEGAFKLLRNAIRSGIIEGRSTAEIVRDIRGTRAQGFKDGILQISRRHAETTVRTAISHTANAARDKFYSANADKFRGVEWLSILDSRTSTICRARDGQVYEVGKGPRPPAHPNCRSTTVPVLKSYQDLQIDPETKAVRRKMDGKRAQDVTYGFWLRRQSVETQNDIMGVTKATLFRNGGLKIERFVDKKGAELTLKQLKKLETEAWTKAGLS